MGHCQRHAIARLHGEAILKPFAHQDRIVREAVTNLRGQGYHAIFAEVGTGKSKMILDCAAALQRDGQLDGLVVAAPKSLAGTWHEQFGIHMDLPGSSFAAFDSTRAKTQKWMAGYKSVLASAFPVLFTNTEAYQTMPDVLIKVLKLIQTGRRLMLVIDESSDIKGPKANRALNLTKIGQSFAFRMISTGTEITNSVLDIYQQFEFLRPGFFGFRSFFFFKNYYAILEERYLSGGRTFKAIVGFRKMEELQKSIEPYTSRARKKDCLDLPEKIHANMPVTLEGPCKRAYDELKATLLTMLDTGELVTVVNKIALFTKFRQIVGGTLAGVGIIDGNNAKIRALIGELGDHGEQAIVWSCFTEEINLLCDQLQKAGNTTVRFDGHTSDKDRESAIGDFRSGKARLFIANPAAASQGLNLQTAHIQYWYSLPTQAKHYEQGEGRTHRSGQTQACLYKKILAEGTVDYRISQILEDKTDVMSSFRDGTISDLISMI